MAAMQTQPRPSLMAEASPALRAAIERVAKPVTLEPGGALFSQNDAADALYILDEGEIEISVLSAGGRKLGLEIITAGEIFGEIGLFAGRRTASATALGRTRLRTVRRAELMAAIKDEPELALQFIDILCERLRIISEKLEDRWFLPLPTRLARRLLHLAEKLAAANGRIPVSQADLADFAGATRESVARALAVWREQGWVELSRGAIRITNQQALEALAAAEDE